MNVKHGIALTRAGGENVALSFPKLPKNKAASTVTWVSASTGG